MHAKKAIGLDPNNSVAYYNLALATYYKGNYTSAKKYCDKAIAMGIEPDKEFVEAVNKH